MPKSDPRTVARDIPGVLDSIFPQLTPGIVGHYNRLAEIAPIEPIPDDLVRETSIQRAMLFEIGFALGEQALERKKTDWQEGLEVAVTRQMRHFDAIVPATTTEIDCKVAHWAGKNLADMTLFLADQRDHEIVLHPTIPGFQWIASGNGDISAGKSLFEVKYSGRNFSSSDYRQIVMYWLLSFAASIESNSPEWTEGILMNPRSGLYVSIRFDEFLGIVSAGKTKVEILQAFSAMVSNRGGIDF